MKKRYWSLIATSLAVAVTLLGGCSNRQETPANTVRLGYFPNVTHLAAIVGLEKGYFQEELGKDIKLETKAFPNGSLFMEAMSTNQIDVGYVGPAPAMINFSKNPTHQLLAGASNGGAVLVVRGDENIASVGDLAGKQVAIPSIGSTQDIMLQKALLDAGLKVKTSGGSVNTIAQSPADIATLFLQKDADAAAVQEPWGVNLQTKAGGKLLLDWDQFAWGKDSTNTVIVGTNAFTQAHPDLAVKLLKAHIRAIRFIQKHPDEARKILIAHIRKLTGKELKDSEVKVAIERSRATYDVNEEVLKEMASINKDAGYMTSDNIDGFVNLSFLKQALK